MSSSSPTLPPLDKINLISIWTGTVLFGRSPPRRHFCCFLQLCTSAFLCGSSLKHSSTPPSLIYHVTKTYVYVIIGWIQDLVLTWRMYIIYDRNWKIIIVPLLIEHAQISCAIVAAYMLSQPGALRTGHTVRNWSMAGWSLDLIINVGVTLAIAGRLWYMCRKVSYTASGSHTTAGSMHTTAGAMHTTPGSMYTTAGPVHGLTSPNRYLSTIFTVVESGALFTSATIVMVVLYLSGSIVALAWIDVATQLAATTPLLIVFRVGLGLTHGLPHRVAGKSARSDDCEYGPRMSAGPLPQSFGKYAARPSHSVKIDTMPDTMISGEETYSLNDLKAHPSAV
ncbi:hypothetical protein PLICRDRAFT_180151 [Plicaturopsis crispa FD-325 SS-3]|uniref:Uncharacterized protein n=1 Tax=Plicaturopsis crispa FD-325 SS-3 TaxID=944288 RepID=A0A0C9T3F2_PLICR|nr:hypothetical protein PLICRDRAFT_180151 [Plicaturopsis crispa FD-325 SS-3]